MHFTQVSRNKDVDRDTRQVDDVDYTQKKVPAVVCVCVVCVNACKCIQVYVIV